MNTYECCLEQYRVPVNHRLLYAEEASRRTTNDDAFELEKAQECLGSRCVPEAETL